MNKTFSAKEYSKRTRISLARSIAGPWTALVGDSRSVYLEFPFIRPSGITSQETVWRVCEWKNIFARIFSSGFYALDNITDFINQYSFENYQ